MMKRNREYVLSVSYGNYLIQHGGTDKVIREHRDLMNEHEIEYVFLFPISNNFSFLGVSVSVKLWGLNIGNDFKGVYDIDGIISMLDKLNCNGWICKALFIHHLWRIEISELRRILSLYNSTIYIYLHDLYMLCNNNNNNISQISGEYCGFGLTTMECNSNCEYIRCSERARKTFRSLENEYGDRITCIAPSPCVKKIYEAAYGYLESRIIVVPHQKTEGKYDKKNEHRKLRVAFVGAQNQLKGWPVFKKMLLKEGVKDYHDFYYFGNGGELLDGVKKVKVSVQKDGLNAMVDALRLNEIDIALLLSGWPETYSYTYFESYAAGCYVITFEQSGNIADMTMQNGNGYVLRYEDELYDLMKKPDRLKQLVRENNVVFPQRLLLNDEIYYMIRNKHSDFHVKHIKKCGKKRFWSAAYRLINGRKLNAIKTNK